MGENISFSWCQALPPPKSHQGQLCPHLTVVVDAVDQTNPDLGVVVGHEDDVEELLAVGVELPELSVHCLQSLQHPGERGWVSARPPRWGLTPLLPSKTLLVTKSTKLGSSRCALTPFPINRTLQVIKFTNLGSPRCSLNSFLSIKHFWSSNSQILAAPSVALTPFPSTKHSWSSNPQISAAPGVPRPPSHQQNAPGDQNPHLNYTLSRAGISWEKNHIHFGGGKNPPSYSLELLNEDKSAPSYR